MIDLNWNELKTLLDNGLNYTWITDSSGNEVILCSDYLVVYRCILTTSSSGYAVWDATYKAGAKSSLTPQNLPFDSKVIDGKKLYTRVSGKKYSVTVGWNDCYFIVPYPNVKIDGVEVVGGSLGDKVDLWILDTASGTISTIPNYPLNQFGSEVFVSKDYYLRQSKYDADLIEDLQIWVRYNSVSAKDIYVNYLIHELKS